MIIVGYTKPQPKAQPEAVKGDDKKNKGHGGKKTAEEKND